MPKLKKKVLTATLYVYVKPQNKTYAYKKAEKTGQSYSAYVDKLIESDRMRQKPKAA